MIVFVVASQADTDCRLIIVKHCQDLLIIVNIIKYH